MQTLLPRRLDCLLQWSSSSSRPATFSPLLRRQLGHKAAAAAG